MSNFTFSRPMCFHGFFSEKHLWVSWHVYMMASGQSSFSEIPGVFTVFLVFQVSLGLVEKVDSCRLPSSWFLCNLMVDGVRYFSLWLSGVFGCVYLYGLLDSFIDCWNSWGCWDRFKLTHIICREIAFLWICNMRGVHIFRKVSGPSGGTLLGISFAGIFSGALRYILPPWCYTTLHVDHLELLLGEGLAIVAVLRWIVSPYHYPFPLWWKCPSAWDRPRRKAALLSNIAVISYVITPFSGGLTDIQQTVEKLLAGQGNHLLPWGSHERGNVIHHSKNWPLANRECLPNTNDFQEHSHAECLKRSWHCVAWFQKQTCKLVVILKLEYFQVHFVQHGLQKATMTFDLATLPMSFGSGWWCSWFPKPLHKFSSTCELFKFRFSRVKLPFSWGGPCPTEPMLISWSGEKLSVGLCGCRNGKCD